MGNPLDGDGIGLLCFNAAKNWQLGWSDDRKQIFDPREAMAWTGRLVGIADYDNNSDGHPVVLKVETGTSPDIFIGFNRAIGADIPNVEAEANDKVAIYTRESNGDGYSYSDLKAHLVQGEIYTTAFTVLIGSTSQKHELTIKANVIHTTTNRGYADITVSSSFLSAPKASPVPVTPTPSLHYINFRAKTTRTLQGNGPGYSKINCEACQGNCAKKRPMHNQYMLQSKGNTRWLQWH